MTQTQLAAGGRIAPGDPRPAAGRKLMRQINAEIAIEVAAVTSALVNGLGRAPTMGERVEAELIGALLVKGRRKRKRGSCDVAERKALLLLLKRSVFRTIPIHDSTTSDAVTKQADAPSPTG